MSILDSFLFTPDNENEKLVFRAIDKYRFGNMLSNMTTKLTDKYFPSTDQKLDRTQKALDIIERKRKLNLPFISDEEENNLKENLEKSSVFRATKGITKYKLKRALEGLL